ncbi:hypothetical protein AM587_10005404 [Phytophthora nicotianae]|uniref:Uncharacterized protein n=1 Tax=Phytophthora nicotianae TaxID=4792 RepID=A0A0W8E183_PHYNI|nr:hypothetical protein AM587_10005404 [Phytophthora nicotianae]
MAPLVNEETDDLSAATHQAFLRTMLLRDYNKRLEQCVFLVGDNCSVNRRLATLMGVPLVGCASHRLNRAVAAELSEHAEDLDLVQTLMLSYGPPRAEIVHSPDFESDCVRVLKSQGQRLTRSEKSALEAFRVIPAAQAARVRDDAETGGSFVERLQKRRRLEQHQPAYELLGRIPPTSNLAEGFFSVARNTFGLQRHSLQPYTLEMLLFLRQNESFWDARTVENSE